MIAPWKQVRVRGVWGEVDFQIRLGRIDRRLKELISIQASTGPEAFVIIINDNYNFPESMNVEDVQVEFCRMCILMAIVGKIYPRDSLRELTFTLERMRCNLQLNPDTGEATVNI